ncbi:beta-1,3-galactosyltransferase 5-like [Alexandromys fortis]|uniref:beta-1,3-galactosyltransferase 5-like n=1 Tax=Alexandromys fortis TaxID=100897 RepID=UPI0021526AF3|nr:beta-1,3-galactosyltransferase 5-like [Microtus fortis]XP_050018114.1 beta-1,3-galactosyltransferase 5-like [Microtus fortis]XP_050018115.1 beta-1,3-galactosyltransferase 5-like [Microtus fortis]
MDFMKMRLVYAFILTMGVLCFYFSMEPFEEPPFVLKKGHGQFLQLPDIDCKQKPPFLVLLVTSSHKQLEARMAIRKTWGREAEIHGRTVKTLFLLGASDSPDEMNATAQEGKHHRDIIQKDFKDVYYNLTLKTLMGMEWVHHFCPQAAFVMKTDSDMFVNVGYLTELLLKKNKTSRFFTGHIRYYQLPFRHNLNKWFVSKFEYPWDRYPPFCSGTGYIFSSDVASQVDDVSESVPFLKLEDVFVGLCLAKLKIRPEELYTKQTFFPGGLRFSVCRFRKIVTCHYVSPQNLLTYWQALENSQEQNCSDV